MTSATSEALSRYFAEHSFTYLTMTTSAIAIGLLLLVTIERELLRVLAGRSQRRNLAACAVIVIPMAVVFAVVIVARFIRLAA